MKRFALSAAVVVAFAAYAFLGSSAEGAAPSGAPIAVATIPPSKAPAASSGPSSGSTPSRAAVPPAKAAPAAAKPSPAPAPSRAPAPAPAPAAASSGAFKDGTYDGTVADAYFGNVQVAAVIKGGALADVSILQSPGDRGTSKYISQTSLPTLVREAVTAQSAHVDAVSGATQTSQAFVQSLASALSKAAN
ncbi:MAG: FMN-binding protein [Patescibacteria group bacterium]|nr:FMN-binding protein [Patescibacteria group bacterium]